MNVQYAIKDGVIYVLEVNPRASRTVPFVAKVTGVPAAKIAARIMAGESLASFDLKPQNFEFATARHIGVKEAVFPFARFGDKVDTVLGPEMKSTGEVMGIDRDYNVAFAKSQLGGGTRLPKEGTVFVSVRDADKPRILETVRLLAGSRFPGSGDVRNPAIPLGGGCSRQSRSTRWPRAARTSSMPSKTATSSLFSIPRRGRRPWPIAGRCGAQPSCIKSRTTPLSQGPSPQHRVSRPISGVTLRYVPCKIILRPPLIQDRTSAARRTV